MTSTISEYERVKDSLMAHGFGEQKARAAARLLEGVVFDDDGSPSNLEACLAAAESEYGTEAVSPDVHSLTESELRAARGAGMTPERFEAMKGVRTLADWEAVSAREGRM